MNDGCLGEEEEGPGSNDLGGRVASLKCFCFELECAEGKGEGASEDAAPR